jgi:hypothetical protein
MSGLSCCRQIGGSPAFGGMHLWVAAELLCAGDAGGEGGVEAEALLGDLLATHQAITIFIIFDARESCFDPFEFVSAIALIVERHGLLLDGIDTRDATDRCLIKLNGIARLLADFAQFMKLCLTSQEKCAEFILIDRIRHSCSPWPWLA